MMYYYETVSEAVNSLRNRGYTSDLNAIDLRTFSPGDFEIVEVHRYEGNSDPGDEAVVYAIESKSGIKGIIVSGYGASVDSFVSSFIKGIPIRKQ